VPLGKETRHKEKKGKLPVEGALVHEAAHAPASELALAGWLAGDGAFAELNWGCWVGLGLGGGAVQTPPRAAPRGARGANGGCARMRGHRGRQPGLSKPC
jgi:hypothetical protein